MEPTTQTGILATYKATDMAFDFGGHGRHRLGTVMTAY